jgi:hypothetical protein
VSKVRETGYGPRYEVEGELTAPDGRRVRVCTVVHIHGDAAAYEVEFMTLRGRTVAVVTVLPTQLRAVSPRDLTHVRELAAR